MTPKQHDLQPLANQVAGHPDGVHSLEGGKLVVKDCLDNEIEFYQQVDSIVKHGGTSLNQEQVQLVVQLQRWMPSFHGSWQTYSGNVNEAKSPRIVLQNLSHGYVKPNVCDIKLGTQLWDENSSQGKRKRMEQTSSSTTSGQFGIRLTGWQVYDNKSETYHNVDKTFGKTIGGDQLSLGVRMIFASPQQLDAEKSNETVKGVSMVGCYLPKLPPHLVLKILKRQIIPKIHQLIDLFSQLEIRIRGASLLIVYEGHEESLTTAILDDNGKQEQDLKSVDVRLIDFAHATLGPAGQGPDKGILLGLETILRLFDQLVEDLTLQVSQ